MPPEKKNRNIIWMLAGALTVTLILQGISLYLYRSSGAYQLDLSRPGYVREDKSEVDTEEYVEFLPSGEINADIIDEFREVFGGKRRAIESIDAFRDEPLSDETFGLVERVDELDGEF